MAKIALAILTGAAFVYALWLVAAGRELPRPARLSGLRRRFALATLLFVGLLTAGCPPELSPPEQPCFITCYLTGPLKGSENESARENALVQVDLLKKATEAGTIDKDTAAKARASLAREIETLYRANRLTSGEFETQMCLMAQQREGSVEAGDTEEEAPRSMGT